MIWFSIHKDFVLVCHKSLQSKFCIMYKTSVAHKNQKVITFNTVNQLIQSKDSSLQLQLSRLETYLFSHLIFFFFFFFFTVHQVQNNELNKTN